jgi:hypothetical protein
MVAVNALYPWLANKLGRKRLQNTSILVASIGYLAIAAMGWTPVFPFNIALLCLFAILVSGGQSLFYMTCIINMANCVEYNDYKHGERNEAVVSTLRPFMAKFAAAMHTLIVTLVLAVSGTFLLSQSISTLETQRDFFDKKDVAAQQHYIQQIQGYLTEYEGLTSGTEAYKVVADKVEAEIESDGVMSTYQIDTDYVPALKEAMVVETGANGETTELGRLGSFDTASMASGGTYALKIDDLKSGEESAANLSFRDQSTLTMRIWVRVAMTLLPIVLLLLALYTQRKKFFIDEDYYDKMMEEINGRSC